MHKLHVRGGAACTSCTCALKSCWRLHRPPAAPARGVLPPWPRRAPRPARVLRCPLRPRQSARPHAASTEPARRRAELAPGARTPPLVGAQLQSGEGRSGGCKVVPIVSLWPIPGVIRPRGAQQRLPGWTARAGRQAHVVARHAVVRSGVADAVAPRADIGPLAVDRLAVLAAVRAQRQMAVTCAVQQAPFQQALSTGRLPAGPLGSAARLARSRSSGERRAPSRPPSCHSLGSILGALVRAGGLENDGLAAGVFRLSAQSPGAGHSAVAAETGAEARARVVMWGDALGELCKAVTVAVK